MKVLGWVFVGLAVANIPLRSTNGCRLCCWIRVGLFGAGGLLILRYGRKR